VKTAVAPAVKKKAEVPPPVMPEGRIIGITDRLAEYITVISHGSITTPEKGGKAHDGLARAFDVLLSLEGQAFEDAMNHVLSTILANVNNAFDDYRLNRFADQTKLVGT